MFPDVQTGNICFEIFFKYYLWKTEPLLEQGQVEMVFILIFFSCQFSSIYTMSACLFFFLFPVALAKHLGVNITAQKYKDGAQFHKKKS